jgi:Poxvirus A32 protein
MPLKTPIRKQKVKDVKQLEDENSGDETYKEEAVEGANEHDELKTGAYHSRAEALAQVENMHLEPFDYYNLALDSSIYVFGKRRYGKTTFAEFILSQVYPYFKRGGYVFTQTKQNYFWQAHFPENRVYEGVNEEVLQSIIDMQKQMYDAIMNGAQLDILPHIILVFDDVISAGELKKSKLLEKVIYNGRHYFLFVIICSQDVKGIGPALRQNGDLICLTYQTQERSVESIRDDYAYFFDNRYAFNYLLTKNTQDHQLLLIDQTEAKYNIQDIFKVGKAPDPKTNRPVFKIGDELYWRKSGNKYEEQLERSKLVPCSGRQDWEMQVPGCEIPPPDEDDEVNGMKSIYSDKKEEYHWKLQDTNLSNYAQNLNPVPSAEKFHSQSLQKPRSVLENVMSEIGELAQVQERVMNYYVPLSVRPTVHGYRSFNPYNY